ncbi:MAG: hypothetical protein JXB85_02180 [Anaerolineales bacterium]|nr:hypothetical protein [Anaerolineales bacterium]
MEEMKSENMMVVEKSKAFLGVIILESLCDQSIMQGVTVLKESDIQAPPDDPYPIWSCRLVRILATDMEPFANRLAANMKEDFYNHFVDDRTLVVVFKGRYFFLDKRDKTTWVDMIHYGETVRVSSQWTTTIPVEEETLL